MIKLAKRKRLKRKTQRERWGETRPVDWLKLFPKEMKENEILTRVRSKVQKEILSQSENQGIGELREEKVRKALDSLKKGREICDYFWLGKLSYHDLIEGEDFAFVYINGQRKFCRFSVTGERWVEKHKKNHPEVPVLAIALKEEEKSIKEKIITLKKNNGDHPHQ